MHVASGRLNVGQFVHYCGDPSFYVPLDMDYEGRLFGLVARHSVILYKLDNNLMDLVYFAVDSSTTPSKGNTIKSHKKLLEYMETFYDKCF